MSGLDRFAAVVVLCVFSAGGAAQPTGTMLAWGRNDNSQAVAQPGEFRAVATGHRHSLALRDDGSLLAWGAPTFAGVPLLNVPSGNDFVAIAAGWSHSLALRLDWTIEAWGYKGQNNPVQPAPGVYIAIAAGEYFSVALRADGSLYAWGETSYCNTCSACPGSPLPGPPWDLTAVPAGNDFVAISASGHFGLAQRADGTLAAWGADQFCQVTNTPTQPVLKFSAGHHHGWAMPNLYTFVGWGHNGYGQAITTPLVDPCAPGFSCRSFCTPDCYRAPPAPFPNHLQHIYGGYYHSIGSDGWSLFGWGKNVDDQSEPPVIPYGCPILQVSCSYDHGLVLIQPAIHFGDE